MMNAWHCIKTMCQMICTMLKCLHCCIVVGTSVCNRYGCNMIFDFFYKVNCILRLWCNITDANTSLCALLKTKKHICIWLLYIVRVLCTNTVRIDKWSFQMKTNKICAFRTFIICCNVHNLRELIFWICHRRRTDRKNTFTALVCCYFIKSFI